jgi:hypothetical protein
MHSSTSSSELSVRFPRLTVPPAVILLLAIAALLLGFEVAARRVVESRSKVQSTLNREYAEAIQIRQSPGSNLKQLLVIGNSLVGHGLDFEELKRGLPPQWQAHRFWVYNTGYTDWYFGLRRLFSEGSRPNTVAVVFAGLHWYTNGIRGDYSSQYLFQTPDLLQIAAEAHLGRTETANLFFARYSKFYALRADIRKVFLNSLLPDLPGMATLFKPGVPRLFTDEELVPLLTRRIGAYRRIVEAYRCNLILIVPPIPPPNEEHQQAIRIAARNAGVQVVMPMSRSSVPAGDFLDDIHLTPAGASLYTAKVAKELSAVLR